MTLGEYFDKAVVNVYSKDDKEQPPGLPGFWACVEECECFM